MKSQAAPRGRRAVSTPVLCVALLTGVALAARLYQLATPVLRWDEGWSLAHARLPWAQLAEIAMADRHPPLYFAMLKLWLVTGKSTWGIRFLSVIPGVLAVPLMYHVARAWMGDAAAHGKRRVYALPLLAAAFAALWPLLVYYGQVARMYSWSALWVLGAAWCALYEGRAGTEATEIMPVRKPVLQGDKEPVRKPALQGDKEPVWKPALQGNKRPVWKPAVQDVGLVLCSAAALYTLYHTALVLAGLWLYAIVVRPRRLVRLVLLGVATVALFAPWLVSALFTLEARMGAAQTSGAAHSVADWLRLLAAPIEGLAFVQGSGRRALVALGAILVAAFVLGRSTRKDGKKLLLPILVLGLSVVGVAVGSQQLWFAPRHLVPATPFLGLLLAWALARLLQRGWPLFAMAALGLAFVYGPASTRFVYAKTLEVVDPFDPTADYRYLAEYAGTDDLVYFNALAKAGWYENLRRDQDPVWSYAMCWEPVIEPMERIAERIRRDADRYGRMWFVLYNGDYGPNAELVAWLNEHLYPAGGEWRGDTLYLAYAVATNKGEDQARRDRFEEGVTLVQARWSPSVQPGGAATVTLVWQADAAVTTSYAVFVHLVDATGRVIAQHDSLPGTGVRPTDTWALGERTEDRHGLFVPGSAPAELFVRVGLYDAATGERLHLINGEDATVLGAIRVGGGGLGD